MGCPQTLVDIALSYAPSDYPEAKYLEAVLPYDTSAYQMAAGQPYPKGMSSCAIFQLGNYGRAGFRAPGIGEPYAKYVGQAESLLVAFGKAQGALDTRPDPHTFGPGDVFHVDNISHWGMVEKVEGDVVFSIDGGQPGVARRQRRIVKNGGAWALVGDNGQVRPVLHVIKADRLNVPCTGLSTRGWVEFGVFLICAGGAAAFTKWLVT
jgi:hypothetical protein